MKKQPTLTDLPRELLEGLKDPTRSFLLITGLSSTKDWESIIKNYKIPVDLITTSSSKFTIKLTKRYPEFSTFVAEKLKNL